VAARIILNGDQMNGDYRLPHFIHALWNLSVELTSSL